jgi:hypothetical protein
MYVRWKKKRLSPSSDPNERWHKADDWSLYPVLVRSERVGGKPRQRVIKHLGRIYASKLEDAVAQEEFWDNVKYHLDQLAPAAETRAAIEEQIARTVPMVCATREGAMAILRERDAHYERRRWERFEERKVRGEL